MPAIFTGNCSKDKECVLNCVKLDAKDYKFASNELKVDEEIVIAALKQDKSIIDDIPVAGREKLQIRVFYRLRK